MAAALLLAGCSDIGDQLSGNSIDNVEVRLTTSSGLAAGTRAADGLYEDVTGFDGTEQAKVYMLSGGTTTSAVFDVGAPYTVSGSEVKMNDLTAAAGETPLKYPVGATGSVTLYGVYPAASIVSHTVAYDQTGEDGYKASDLMYATTDVSWTSLTGKAALITTDIPNLPFRHQLVKLRVVLVKAADVKQVTEVKLKNVKRKVAVSSITATALTQGAVSSADADTDEILLLASTAPETATNDKAAAYTYCCVFPNQAWVDGSDPKEFLTVTADGVTTKYRLKRDDWTNGNEYVLTINLNELALGSTIDIDGWSEAARLDVSPTTTGGSLKMGDVDDPVTYRGTAYTPTPGITYKGDPLTNGTHYDLSYFGNTNAGTAIIMATGKSGSGFDYTGQIGIKQFTILPRSLSTYASEFTITATGPVYNGAAQDVTTAGTFSVVDNGLATGSNYTMVKTTDYTVSGTTSAMNYSATANTLTVTGTGNYTDSQDVTWSIRQRPVIITAKAGEIDDGDTDTYGTTSTGKTFSNLTNSGTSAYTNYVTATATSTPGNLVSGHYISSVKLTPSTTSSGTGTLTPSAATIKNGSGTDVTANYNITYATGVLTVKALNWVDIGLSVLWGKTNLGATNPGDYGQFYAWGSTSGSTDGNFSTAPTTSPANPETLPDAYDAATQSSDYSGGRMPKATELTELVNTKSNTTDYSWQWMTQDGHNGWKITRLTGDCAGNWIFLPAAGCRDGTSAYNQGSYGYYWSSSISAGNTGYAQCLYFQSGNVSMSYDFRQVGFPVRAVKDK